MYSIVNWNLVNHEYSWKWFYNRCMDYESYDVCNALDNWSEIDVKNILKQYILECDYNPKICEYIDWVNWIE